MAKNSADEEYMNLIRKSPKFLPGGTLGTSGFYTQPDGSKHTLRL